MDLALDPDDLNKCVQCGLCLPSCPTYRVTGDETRSPRGRIGIMREVQNRHAPLTPEVVESLDSCVQCRGCEPACPSAVPYGRLIEQATASLAQAKKISPWWLRAGLGVLDHPVLLRTASRGLALAQRTRLLPPRFDPGKRVALRSKPLIQSGSDVILFTGCVMDAWQRQVHHSTIRVLEAAGFGVTPTGDSAPCCGALNAHAGLEGRALANARQVIATLGQPEGTPPIPILVNSAGCGAALKEYGEHIGTPEAVRLADRVQDISEFLAANLDRLPSAQPLDLTVAVQDPCHLRHVQKVHQATRLLLGPYVSKLVELDDDGLCCGAGGAYSVTNRDMSLQIRQRKLDILEPLVFDVVSSANPGCALHLAAAGVPTIHPICLIAQALDQDSA